MAATGRHDLTADTWAPWIAEVCARLGVDPSLVDVPAIHDLTRQVAHRYERPMAPVSAHLVGIALGMALAADPDLDAAALLAELHAEVVATLPSES